MDGSKEMKSSEEIERRTSHVLSPSQHPPNLGCSETTTHEGQVQDLTSHLVGLDLVRTGPARNMSKIEMISVGWNICNSWAGIAATFALAIRQGGPVVLIYGPIMMFILVGACALTLAELASVYPTAGGQYHWTSILAPKKWSRGLVSALLFA